MAITTVIANPGFESGDTGWDKGSNVVIDNTESAHSGSYQGRAGSTTADFDTDIWNQNKAEVIPGQVITASCFVSGAGHDGNAAAVQLQWQDSLGATILVSKGNESPWSSPGGWYKSTVTATAPTGAAYVRIGAFLRVRENGGSGVDDFEWSYTNNRTATLITPADGSTFVEGSNVNFSVEITGDSPSIVRVDYKDGATVVATTAAPDYSYNISTLALGAHAISAVVVLSDGTNLTTDTHNITIAAFVPPPETREFRASNSYTQLITENFFGLTAGMPATALVTGVEVELSYSMKLLVRSKDVGITDPAGSNADVIFDVTNGGMVEAALFSKDGTTYTKLGGVVTEPVPIDLIDFSQEETGISEGKKWTVFAGTAKTLTLGSDQTLFGQDPIAAADFIKHALGFKFYPVPGSVPSYAEVGDACIRFFIDQLRVRVYFDAGSVEYYFASPDKTQVIKGELVHSYVFDGGFKTGDATGVLELKPVLEVMDGTQTWIGDDWTIHSAYPPTDANQIGDVASRPIDDGIGQSYNGLPTQQAIVDNRSRYEMITNNFYGDVELDSIYGVNGVGRAFAYNGDFFHNIYTQPAADKDKPRHVAHHHSHLALGFDQGRLDLSVVGEPYNYSGLEGASSWAIGDPITGLLPLSGTLLGIFCKKSVWGISGTTVDNFATQVIAPRIGAVEYTIADMGFPVYANTYGIYTLSQTSEYGDYLGTPMSQDVSPWLRPRLVRTGTSDKEVVVAWPVRSKNQYKLCFSDGYILTMTLNAGSSQAPTFSLQRYDITT